MTYFAQDGAMHGWNGEHGYTPPAPITRNLCEVCAIPEVPLERIGTLRDGSPHYRQCRPWKWAPSFGALCDTCDKRC